MKLEEIASRINAHLRRLERDPEWNKPSPVYKTRNLYHSGAMRAGSYVQVWYVSYQGTFSWRKAEALAYLEWLDKGNKGLHWEMRK